MVICCGLQYHSVINKRFCSSVSVKLVFLLCSYIKTVTLNIKFIINVKVSQFINSYNYA